MNPRRARLAARLRAVRASAFRSGNAFAQHLGWVQSRVSKLETGVQLPTEADIHEWVVGCQVAAAVEAELLDLLAAARVEYVNARDVQRAGGGLPARQASLGALEDHATQLAYYEPAIVPGLVQTAAYTRELLSLPGGPLTHGASAADVEQLVAARIHRQEVIYDNRKQIVLVIGQAALLTPPKSLATLRDQLDRLTIVAGLAAVELAVLPLDSPMPALPTAGFALHDDAFVLVETLTAEQRLDEPDEVAVYREAFEHLRTAAIIGPDAVQMIRRLMERRDPTG